MIFELFGIPGSGKSFICSKIEKNGYAKDIMRFYKENFIGKILFHAFLYTFEINKTLRKKYQKIIDILGNPKRYSNIIDSRISIEVFIKYMIFIYFIEKKYITKKDVIIDEGIIHYCIAIYAEYSVELNKIEQIIETLKIYDKKVIIGLRCDKKKAINQMKMRNRKTTAIDFLEGAELEKILDRYIEAEKYFENKFKCLHSDEIENEIRNGKGLK